MGHAPPGGHQGPDGQGGSSIGVAVRFWNQIGAHLRCPAGGWGKCIGHAMAIANARANALAVRAIDPKPGDHILELGCGPGMALRELLSKAGIGQVVGVDQSAAMLAQAAARNRRALAEGRLSLVLADFAALPFADEMADAVLGVNIAYFINGPSPMVEARRLLRPGGSMVLYVTERSAMQYWPFAGAHTHRLFDGPELAALIQDAGFAPEQIRIRNVDAGLGIGGLLAIAKKEQIVHA
jgi:ubiquinone/menaquinone biosynthesis C-methylase UbiE